MKIAAFFPSSESAWPGRKSSVVYTPGCNFECKYCYASAIIKNSENLELIPQEKILEILLKNFEESNSVVISGGEPLIHEKQLVSFLKVLKEQGFETKLDTNGSNSLTLEEILSRGLVDFVSLDIKNQLNDYAYFKITGKKVMVDEVLRSIQALKYYGISHELRMTFVPALHSHHDVLELAKQLKGSKRFVLQQFVNSEGTLSNELQAARSASYEQLWKMAKQIQGIEEVRIRTLKGDEIINPIIERISQKLLF